MCDVSSGGWLKDLRNLDFCLDVACDQNFFTTIFFFFFFKFSNGGIYVEEWATRHKFDSCPVLSMPIPVPSYPVYSLAVMAQLCKYF